MKKTIPAFTLAFSLLASSYGIATQAYAAQPVDQPVNITTMPLKQAGKAPIPGNDFASSARKDTIKIARKRRTPGIRHRPGKRPPLKRSRRSRRGTHRGIQIGVGIAILAIIAAEAARSNGYDRAMRRCARNYRSFDRETGTYVTYGGRVKLCPYLAPHVR
jgi:BA14K-like protein